MTDEPTCVSLFSGIGGLDLGLHRAGWRHILFCESDSYRRDVLRARFPGIPVHEDVRDVGSSDGSDGSKWVGLRERRGAHTRPMERAGVDLLCGGFPCQDVSVAGQRRGLAGERSGLFHEYARIADALRPRWLLVENVPGLLSSNGGRDFGVVLGTLADLGYGVAWRILDSRFFGVPQRRRRVYIVGTVAVGDPRAAAERAGQVLAVGTRCERHPTTRTETGPNTAGTLGGNSPGGGWRLGADEAAVNQLVAGPLLSPPLKVNANGQRTGSGPTTFAAIGATVRRLMPVECERLQALPAHWTDLGGTPDSRRYAALGDAVTASVAEWIGRRLIQQDALLERMPPTSHAGEAISADKEKESLPVRWQP